MRVGFIGLGDQGGPMARMIAQNGHPLTVWARRDTVSAAFADLGAAVARSPAALASGCDLLCICVTNDSDVRSLLVDAGIIDAMAEHAILAIHSTVSPYTCVDMAHLAVSRGVTVLDLPVSGSGHAALDRKLLVLAGGEARSISQIMPVLESYAGTIIRVGDIGTAMNAKLVNNLMAVVNIGQAYRALLLGRSLGVDPSALRQALMAGTGRTFAIDLIRRLHVPARAKHVRQLLEKDVALALSTMPAPERSYWMPLAETGLNALAVLMSGSDRVLPGADQATGELVTDGTT